jgi:NADH:ubiquinone oxidoreductase subunit H
MNAPKKIVEVELHRYFEELKPLLLDKTKKLEEEDLTVEQKANIYFEFIQNAVLLFIPVLKSFIINPVNSAIKTTTKEVKIIGSLGIISVVMLVFFVIGWFTLSVLVGIWFYDHGYTLINSVLYSLIFQLISFVVVSSLGFLVLSKSVLVSFFSLFRKKKVVTKQIENNKQHE